ncbi:sugar ABC transporter ATP-binding protein [Runella sp.]|uniref:sugar ABC transporter ATP-binding protein n=1 Tax=Runella sp. TaxID=1960881 RepID=UPI003D0DECFF
MLEAINISKEFPGVKALSQVNIVFYPAKVNAILGENGAGKSTLLKILTGVYPEYAGEIRLNGQPVKFKTIKEAQQAGIAIIHQELNLISQLNITENLFLGRETVNAFGLPETEKMHRKAQELLEKLQLNVSPKTLIQELKIGEQQLVEIAKALLTNAQIILMDEPTSALTDKEITDLHRIIGELKREGKTIVYISHKMDELFKIVDRYTVLRDGRTIDAGEMSQTNEQELIRKMVGREVQITKKETSDSVANAMLKVEKLTLKHPSLKNKNMLQDISFEVKKGEIVGIFGLMGAGRTELLETIFGTHPSESHFILEIEGERRQVRSPKEAIQNGIAFVTEDRKSEGLVLGMSVAENISLTTLPEFGVLNAAKDKTNAQGYIKQLNIKTPSENQACVNLSGGNQQKVVLAKWLATHPKILLLDEPTRGIDINAKNEIYQLVKKMAKEGLSILLVSSEIPEILALSDRILVMAEGKIKASLQAGEADEDTLLKAAI